MARGKFKYEYIKKYQLCSKEHFQIVKGIAILAAIIASFFDEFYEFDYASYIIHSAAAIFFVCSGYGVSESFRRKGGLFHYWENKLVKVWLPSAVAVIVLNLIRKGSIASWIDKYPLGLMGDWLYLIFAGYGAFWLIFKLMENKTARIVSLFACAAVAFALLPQNKSIVIHVFAFPVGVLLSQTGCKRSITDAGWGKRIAVLGIGIAVAAVGFLVTSVLKVPYVTFLIWSVCFLAVAISVMLLTYYLQKLPIFGVFAPIGLASYGLYLFTDDIFRLFDGQKDTGMHVAMFGALLAVALAYSILRELMIQWNRRMRKSSRRR